MILFNKPPYTGNEDSYVIDAISSNKISGDGAYMKKCQHWFEDHLGCDRALMTPSCTHALEMAALLIDILPGDEVILPSYTFVSTANAFVLRGAKIVFVDIRPDTMNINEKLIESAITNRTKAIVPVHYAGVACEMNTIMEIADQYKLFVIEDAAQGMMSTYNGKSLGTIGHLGAYSFHETKNYTSGGEGGLLIINDERFMERAEIIREKGTNRNQFFRGQVDKYSWCDLGSSYLPCELQAAYLYAQLENADTINHNRIKSWKMYDALLSSVARAGRIELPLVPENCEHNGHMFFIKAKDVNKRTALINCLKKNGVNTVFHYVPLHSSDAGHKYGFFSGVDRFTTSESERLIRLPMYYGLEEADIKKCCDIVSGFYSKYE